MAQDNEWELSKENIKPLKSGRRLGELTLALKHDITSYKKTIEEFEMQLRVLEDEDLLNKWFDYICWVEQRCISSNNECLSLMKRCVKHFKNKTDFKNNPNYTRIWIKISEMVDEPNDIFNYMFDQDIGTSLAVYYRTWAEHNELIGHKKKADEIFILGINRNADPVDTLKRKHTEFERRMAKTPCDPESDSEENDDGNKRTALAHLHSKSGKVGSVRTQVKGRRPLGSITNADNTRKVSAPTIFNIFDDENPNPSSLLPPTSSGKIKNLPFNAKGKENKKKVEKMSHVKIVTTVPVFHDNAFEIFHDTEEEESLDASHPVSITSRKPLQSITLQIAEMTDIVHEIEEDSSDTNAQYMFSKKVYMGSSEVSLEELKAQLLKYRKC